MVNLIFLIEQNAVPIYILCGAGLLFWGWKLFRSQRKLAQALFELEREYALNERARNINWVGLLLFIILATHAIAQVVAPYLRANPIGQSRNTPLVFADGFVTRVPGARSAPVAAQIAGSATPAPAAGAAAMGAGAMGSGPTDIFSGQVDATYTPSPTPPGTIIPDVPSPVGCADPGAMLTHPLNGQVLFEAVVVEGAADVPGFSSYKFELKGPSTNDAWAVLRTYSSPVPAGVLGQFDGSAFTPGTYQFRLAVVDSGNTTIASCAITIIISEPIPTPTRIRSQ